MNYTNRRVPNNKFVKSFKDYLVPYLIILLVLFFVGKSWLSGESTVQTGTIAPNVEVSLGTPDTEAYAVLASSNKTKLEGKVSLYRGEKLQVVNGNVLIKSTQAEMNVNKLGELRYNEDDSYTLYSSDLWIKANASFFIEMRYAKIGATEGSVFSLSQNEVASTIYVVTGTLEVQNLAKKSTILSQGEKLVIMRNNSKDEKTDLSLSKTPIDDYIKIDDWFIKNGGNIFLEMNHSSAIASGSSQVEHSSTGNLQNNSGYILFQGLYDEMELKESVIDINGTILSDEVGKIDINGTTATIDTTLKTFTIKSFALSSKNNDLVYRVFDSTNKLLYKGVMTVNTSNISRTSQNSTSSLAQVENYPITTSPLYQILTPKMNPFTTTEDIVRIEGTVPARTVEKIIVNDFELKKFPRFGTYWSYFANSEFGNLKEGINIYKIQYFGTEEKLLYENNFTIIKNPKPAPIPVTPPTSSVTPPVSTPESSEGQTLVENE